MGGAHSRLSPSSAPRWMACPGSVLFCDHLPEPPTSSYAAEGTRAHALLEACIKEKRYPHNHEGDDAEMRDCVGLAFEYVEPALRAGFPVEAERRVPMIYGEGQFGTVDVTVVWPGGQLEIIDFKYGAGVFVPAKANWQLAGYMTAVVGLSPGVSFESINGTIIQPRSGNDPIRSWQLSQGELATHAVALQFAAEFVFGLDKVEATKVLRDHLHPGEEQCRWCAASVVCPARRDAALNALQLDYAGVSGFAGIEAKKDFPVPAKLTPAQLAEILAVKGLITSWLKGVEAEALSEARRGVMIPGWKLVEAEARRAWLLDDVDMNTRMLSNLTNGDVPPSFFTRPETCMPITEAESALKNWASSNALRGQKRVAAREMLEAAAVLMDKKSSSALTLAREADPRPPVNPAGSYAGTSIPAIEN